MSAPTVVMKFGGTSLSSAERIRQAAGRIRAHRDAGSEVVAVVSANGSSTDRILRWLGAVREGPGGEEGPHGAAVSEAPACREADRALATGEDLSASLLAAALGGAGVPAQSLRGSEAGVRGSGDFGRGVLEGVDPGPLRQTLAGGATPVVSGFQAIRPDGETITLGRGGSDVTAVAIAAALVPSICHIVTDVHAVHDRDPRRSASARPLCQVSLLELVRMTEGGAQVVHPAAARLAMERDVPMRVYGFWAPPLQEGGTTVMSEALCALGASNE